MSAEAARLAASRAGARPHVTHVLVCGATDAAVDVAMLLRRLDEAVTLLADDLRAEARQRIERAGVRVVIGPPHDAAALAEAGVNEARVAIVAVGSDLASIENVFALRRAHPSLPLVWCGADPELASRAERSLGIRTAVCTSVIEAAHLAGCAAGPDVVGAFDLGDDLVLLRRRDAAQEPPPGSRVLMIEQRDGRSTISPPAGFPVSPGAVVTTIERVRGVSWSPWARIVRAVAEAMRTIRGNTPAALGWTAAVLALLAAASVFVFMAGMDIPFSDAAYLVLNTISAVGYGDITPFGSGRVMHLAGSFVALLGPALLGAWLLIFARVVLRPQRSVPPSRGHVVVVAPHLLATAVASRLERAGIAVAVASPETLIDSLLRETNAASASALIAATSDPVKNVACGLAAREANRSIHIVVGGPPRIARDLAMASPSSAAAASVSLAASAALVAGVRYAVTIGASLFSLFEGGAGSDWVGQRPSDVAGSYNFTPLFRRPAGGAWRPANDADRFEENETILVAAWRRLDPAPREEG